MAPWRFLAGFSNGTHGGHLMDTISHLALPVYFKSGMSTVGNMMEYLDEYSISEVTDTTIAAHRVTLPL